MTKDTANNFRLGLFISSGLLILIVSLYLIGKNQNFFGSSFHVRARFSNISGLVIGNNVRYSGIQAGTVDNIHMLNDTTVEIFLLIDKKLQPYIHENTIASIGNDGLMGNKVINLSPNRIPAPEIKEGGLLYTKNATYTDEMIETLSGTNVNVKLLSERLITTVDKVNNSEGLWRILGDTTLSQNIRISMSNIKDATANIKAASKTANDVVKDVQEGRGPAGVLLTDKKVAEDLKHAISDISDASSQSNTVLGRIDSIVKMTQHDLSNGNGPIHTILKDSATAARLNSSIINIQKGTAAFNEDMEALKHNFLTKRYFRKKAKRGRVK